MGEVIQFKTRTQKASEELSRHYDELLKRQAEERMKRALENLRGFTQ